MRVFIAGLLGGFVLFMWGFVAHTLLPIGNMGVGQPAAEEPVLSVLRDNLPSEGVYMVPGLAPEKMSDEAAVKAYSEKAKANPYAFIVYQPQGVDGMEMTDNLIKQLVSDTLAAFIAAFVLALGAFGFAKRVLVSVLLGLFAWLTISFPYWNWYRFPMEFTVANLLEQVLGWLFAGMAIAWWLGRRGR